MGYSVCFIGVVSVRVVGVADFSSKFPLFCSFKFSNLDVDATDYPDIFPL